MLFIQDIIGRLMETDDDTIKDILGSDYLEINPNPEQRGEVDRHGRWADIEIGGRHFCISYLTPVAFTSGNRLTITARNWSVTTKKHIVKWANHLGLNYSSYAELEGMATYMPQEELNLVFKQSAQRVRWSKKQVKASHRLPDIPYGLKSTGEDHISLDTHT